MPEAEMVDLIVVGGGPGGLTAGLYAMRAALKTVLIEKALPGGQINLTESVENYPGFENISGFDLSQKFLQHAQSYGLDIRQAEVAAVEPGLDYHTVRLANGDQLNAHAVVLATGGSPRKLDVPGELENYGRGVSYCATCDGFFFRDKTVVVVGGGDTALEEALYLAKITRQVYLVHRRDAFRASRILQQRLMSEGKIDVLWNTVVTEIKTDEQGVAAVALKDTQTGAIRELATDGVFIFIGFVPNNNLVPPGIRMDHDGYVMTDERCETNIPGIFVIGDLRQKYAKQIVLAAADGCTAALSAALCVEMKKAGQSCPLPRRWAWKIKMSLPRKAANASGNREAPMPLEDYLQPVAFVAKSLSDENRLRILLCVNHRKKSVSEVVEELNLSQPLVSHHLKELRRSLLVKVERSGPFVYYEIADARIQKILEALKDLATDLLAQRKTF